MSEFKGTPGPWRIARKRGITGFIKSIGPCAAEEYAGSSWLEVSDDDANLIAAAPELLEALIYLVKQDYNLVTGRGFEQPALDSAIAAIAKALGEQK